MNDRTIAFLLGNMKEMEIELRAQSIAMEALGAGVVEVCDLQDALRMARGSEAMLAFVEDKYKQLTQMLPATKRKDPELSKLLQMRGSTGYMH